MTDDPFDPDNLRIPDDHFVGRQARYQASRDGELRVLRAIWESVPSARREPLKVVLRQLEQLARDLTALSRCLWAAPNIATDTRLTQEISEEAEPASMRPLYRLVAQSPGIFCDPGELLCAIACWEAGEEYLPASPVDRHPRWQVPSRRDRLIIDWENTVPAPEDTTDDPGGLA